MVLDNFKLNENFSGAAKSLLIGDQIFVLSFGKHVYFYCIGNDISNPTLTWMQTYKIKDNTKDYYGHGMCLTECSQLSSNGKSWQCKILLFGGYNNYDFFSSFLELKIELTANAEAIGQTIINIWENSLRQVKCVNLRPKNDFNITNRYWNFGFECLLNSRNETIIIMNAMGGGKDSLFEYNVLRNQLFRHKIV